MVAPPAQEPLLVLASLASRASLGLRLVPVSLPHGLSPGRLGVPPTCALVQALAPLVARPVAARAVQALGVVLGQWALPEQHLGPVL